MTSQGYDAYEDEQFESDGSEKNAAPADALFKLKFSVDIRSVKNMKVAGNALVKWQLNLGVGKGASNQFHQFKSNHSTPVSQGGSETKLEGSYASYEFLANKAQLGAILGRNELNVSLIQQDGNRQMGEVSVPLKMLEQGEHKKTVDSMIIVSDKYLELK